MGVSLLRAEEIRHSYAGRQVLDLDEFSISSGEVVALLGPNGAGKSTLFRLLLLLERADSGRIFLDGREVEPGDTLARRGLAGIFQRPILFSGTVAENVVYGLRVRGSRRREREARVEEILAAVGLERLADAPVETLSGGEAQRVALARALAIRPDLLLLDEPTSNLDITVRRHFREDLIRLIRQHARGALLITHDPGEAFTLADRVVVIQGGRLVQEGTPEELVVSPGTPFVAAFTGAELLLNGTAHSQDERLLRVRVNSELTLVTAVLAPDTPSISPGEPVHLAYRPEDVLLSSPEGPAEVSARNQFSLRVEHLAPSGGLVRIQLRGAVSLVSLVTRPAAESLGLRPGRVVVAHLKATALRVYRAADHRGERILTPASSS